MKRFLAFFVFFVFCGFSCVCRAEYLEDVVRWYASRGNEVYQSLQKELGSRGIEVRNIDVTPWENSNGFRLKEESYVGDKVNCNYDIHFSCDLNGKQIRGNALGFAKYGDEKIDWFYIDLDSGSSSLPSYGENTVVLKINRRREYVDILQRYIAYLVSKYPIRSQYGRNDLKNGYYSLFSNYEKR